MEVAISRESVQKETDQCVELYKSESVETVVTRMF